MTTDTELVPLGDDPAGTVLAGVDAGTGEAYAVKLLPGRPDRRTRTALDAELRTLAGLRERAPILAADGVEDLADGRPGLRMELCSQSLAELVAAFGPLSVPDAVALGRSLAEALAAAHGAGVVHGAVTPGNVLFRASGEAVLSDFGLVLRRAFPADPARALGFVAPETLRDGTLDERSDLYGLGAVLHLALTGAPPHPGRPGEPDSERLLRVLTEPVPPIDRDGLPAAVAELVGTLLDRNPDRRPADAATVVQRIGGTTTAPQPRGEPLLVFGPGRRSPLRMPPKVAVALALVAAAGLLFWVNRPDDLDMPALPPPAVASAAAPSAPAVRLELAEVTDRGNVADLAWRSSEPLSFAIIVAGEGRPSRTIIAQQATTYSVPIDPVRKYCFLVQATDGVDIFTTAPRSIRGAVCKENQPGGRSPR
jgi:hypothetical protein